MALSRIRLIEYSMIFGLIGVIAAAAIGCVGVDLKQVFEHADALLLLPL